MRTKESIKNSTFSMLSNIITMLVGFISQAIFIRILGAEYLGLNGLFTNILTMLSFFELGLGNAIIYNLYKPLAVKNYDKVNSLLNFYKKSFNIIASLILIVGLMLIPFLPYIVGKISVDVNVTIIYVMFLLNTVVSYLMVYKRNLIYADQKGYIISIIHIFYIIIMNVLQLIFLIFTKNYYIYLLIKILSQICENVVITITANIRYKNVLNISNKKIDKETKDDIFKRVKASVYHKLGTVVVSGTDNILISMYFGVYTVGLYSNYFMIINAISLLFGQIITATTSSFGNLLVLEKGEKIFDRFDKIRFLNFWLAVFSSVSLLLIISPFITLWLGKKYLLENAVLFALVFNYFQKLMRNSYNVMRDAAGICVEDKYIPIFESIINILASIILLKIFGLAGVFLGTIVSGFVLWFFSYPKYVYKRIFNRSLKSYFKETLTYISIFIVIAAICFCTKYIFTFSNNFVNIILSCILSIIIPNLILLIIYKKNNNFLYFKKLLLSKLKKI